MFRASQTPVYLKPASLSVVMLPAFALSACSEMPRLISDYLAAICRTSFRSSSPEESSFLAENVSAMKKMMIDMSIRPAGNIDATSRQ